MSKLTIVVERVVDTRLLRKLLSPKNPKKYRFSAGQGRVGLPTIARNLVVIELAPTLVVMDADTTDLAKAEDTRLLTKSVIAHVSGDVPMEVFAFVPTIEAIFFEAPDALASILGRDLAPTEIQSGKASPRATLHSLPPSTPCSIASTKTPSPCSAGADSSTLSSKSPASSPGSLTPPPRSPRPPPSDPTPGPPVLGSRGTLPLLVADEISVGARRQRLLDATSAWHLCATNVNNVYRAYQLCVCVYVAFDNV